MRMSTTFRPQTDGQAVKVNSIVESYIRTFAAANERHCDQLLTLLQPPRAQGYRNDAFRSRHRGEFRMPLEIMAAASRRPGGEAIAVSFATKMNILRRLTDARKVS